MDKQRIIILGKELSVAFLIILFIFILLILIKPVSLFGTQHQITEDEQYILEDMFGQENAENLTIFYTQSSLIKSFDFGEMRNASFVLCRWIFIDESMEGEMSSLVHETFHTLQSKRQCNFKGISLHWKTFFTGADYRDFYYYNITTNEYLNIEQEAAIVEGYYLLKYEGIHPANIYPMHCLDCFEYKKKELLPFYEEKFQSLMEKYG